MNATRKTLFWRFIFVGLGLVVFAMWSARQPAHRAAGGAPKVEVAATLPEKPREPTDVDRIYALGNGAVATGVATHYDVSGWHMRLDLTISSLLPGDARAIANALCGGGADLQNPWTLRVFILTSSAQPAATCQL